MVVGGGALICVDAVDAGGRRPRRRAAADPPRPCDADVRVTSAARDRRRAGASSTATTVPVSSGWRRARRRRRSAARRRRRGHERAGRVAAGPVRHRRGDASSGRSPSTRPGPALMVPAAVPVPTPERPTVLRGLVDGAVGADRQRPVRSRSSPGGAFTVPVAVDARSRGARGDRCRGQHRRGDGGRHRQRRGVEPPADRSAVHVTARSWADPAVREPILRARQERADQRRPTRHQGRERRGRVRQHRAIGDLHRSGAGSLRRRVRRSTSCTLSAFG